MIDTKPIHDKIENLEQEITRLKVIENTADMIVNRLEEKFGELGTEIDINNPFGVSIYFISLRMQLIFTNNVISVSSKGFIKNFIDFNKVVNYIIEEVGD